ncbi:MAG: beta-propeller domain-containing protein [Polyangiaceae bacterium]|nr:beta-propeller domain-containing protein [Polyangiaceae bacterium]
MSAAAVPPRIEESVLHQLGSNLYVVDVEVPGQPEVLDRLTHLATGEDVHATRFDGDVAYVVTYEPVVVQIDPLWVVSLADPTQPRIVAELEVAGWSDFVFPRGDRLVAVGRGDRGQRTASSLRRGCHGAHQRRSHAQRRCQRRVRRALSPRWAGRRWHLGAERGM